MWTLSTLFLLTLLGVADAPVEADVVIRGATLYDGTGSPGVVGDLALRGERVVAVGRFTVAGKPKVLDGTGLALAPGFIDLHTHSDSQMTRPRTRDNHCDRQLRCWTNRRRGLFQEDGGRRHRQQCHSPGPAQFRAREGHA